MLRHRDRTVARHPAPAKPVAGVATEGEAPLTEAEKADLFRRFDAARAQPDRPAAP